MNLYLLWKKDEAPETYKLYEAWAKTQLDAPIKILHSDWEGEYLGKEFILYLKSRETEQKLIVHDTPQQNGVAKCQNQTIVKQTQALLHTSSFPRSLWGEAMCHVLWLMNRTPTKAVVGKTPFEATFRKKPNLGEVWEWGNKVWVGIEGEDKLGGRVKEGRWMGILVIPKVFMSTGQTKGLLRQNVMSIMTELGHQSPISKGRNGMNLSKKR